MFSNLMCVCVCVYMCAISVLLAYCKSCLSSSEVEKINKSEIVGLMAVPPPKGGQINFPVIVIAHWERWKGVGLPRRRRKSISAATPHLKNIQTNERRSLTPLAQVTDLLGPGVERDRPNVHINPE